eukprot:365164-Chlamydomonas_euryale.AAC.2
MLVQQLFSFHVADLGACELHARASARSWTQLTAVCRRSTTAPRHRLQIFAWQPALQATRQIKAMRLPDEGEDEIEFWTLLAMTLVCDVASNKVEFFTALAMRLGF